MKPPIAVIVPCLNEEQYIARCLDSILQNDYPIDLLDVVIVDGMSTDKTCDIVKEYQNRFTKIRVIPNTKKTKPVALNLGIRNTTQDIIARIDAHAEYAPDYFSKLISTLHDLNADLVGAKRITSITPTFWGRIITSAIDHKFAAGDAHYRTTANDQPKDVASVFCGFYHRRAFQRAGLFNEALIRTQDRELNTRIKQSGGRIVLDPQTYCTYFARTNFEAYTKWVFDGAFWLFYARRFTKTEMTALRNYIPSIFFLYLVVFLVFVAMNTSTVVQIGAAIPLFFYCILSFLSAWDVAKGLSNIAYIPPIMFVFLWTHLVYGLGSLAGFLSQKLLPNRQVAPPPLS